MGTAPCPPYVRRQRDGTSVRLRRYWRAGGSDERDHLGPERMDSFELNKVLGAVLATCLGLLAVNLFANAMFAPEVPAKPGYEIAVQEEPAGGSAPAQKEPEKPIEQ